MNIQHIIHRLRRILRPVGKALRPLWQSLMDWASGRFPGAKAAADSEEASAPADVITSEESLVNILQQLNAPPQVEIRPDDTAVYRFHYQGGNFRVVLSGPYNYTTMIEMPFIYEVEPPQLDILRTFCNQANFMSPYLKVTYLYGEDENKWFVNLFSPIVIDPRWPNLLERFVGTLDALFTWRRDISQMLRQHIEDHPEHTDANLSVEMHLQAMAQALEQQTPAKIGQPASVDDEASSASGRKRMADMLRQADAKFQAEDYADALDCYLLIYRRSLPAAALRRDQPDRAFAALCHRIGMCYLMLHQYHSAYFFLHIIAPRGELDQLHAYVESLVLSKHPNALSEVRTIIRNVERLIHPENNDEETETELSIAPPLFAFRRFLERTLVTLLLQYGRLDEARDRLNAMLSSRLDEDFALDRLARLQQFDEAEADRQARRMVDELDSSFPSSAPESGSGGAVPPPPAG